MDTGIWQWARAQFGDAQLGDRRRVDRLVRLAASAAARPAGTVTAVIQTSAEREGAFRLLESCKVDVGAVASANHAATVQQCRTQRLVYVPVDGSSLSLTDRVCSRDIGHVGQWCHPSRGLIVASALAVSSEGTPLGLCAQQWWARTERSTRKRRSKFVSPMKTETRHSLAVLEQVHERFARQAPQTQPWFQLDRGYDAWAVLALASERKMLMTLRVANDQ